MEFGLEEDRKENPQFILMRAPCVWLICIKFYCFAILLYVQFWSVRIEFNWNVIIQPCTGSDSKPCSHTVSKKRSENRCFDDPNAGFISPAHAIGPYQNFFGYIAPLDKKDKRVWIGFFSTVPGVQPVHNHSLPVASKLGSGLKTDIAESVKQNPNLKASEICRWRDMSWLLSNKSYRRSS